MTDSRTRKTLAAVLRAPNWPSSVEREPPRRNVGLDYETEWTRRPAARAARRALMAGIGRPLTRALAAPSVLGAEHLEALSGPVIFAANHTSHLDTGIVLTALPARFRDRIVVAAAADYFFDRTWKAALSSLVLGAIPVERTRVNRRSADNAAALIEDGWNLIIFPEGGRSPDGWGQEFRGGAAYLAKRCDVPVVPIHLRGVRPIVTKGSGRIRPGRVEVRFGAAIRALPAVEGRREEDARRMSARIEAAVANLGDEAETDWWSARQRAARGTTTPVRGPQASPWRRAWALPEAARQLDRRAEDPPRPW